MTEPDRELELPSDFVSSTVTHVQRWTVKQFSKLSTMGASTELFTAAGRQWALYVYPDGDCEENRGFISLYVTLVGAYRELYAKWRFAIINQAQERVRVKDSETRDWLCGVSQFIRRSDLLDETKGFMLNDTVTFEVNLTIEQPSEATAAQRALSSFVAALDSGLHSDVTLVCEGEEIRAHKAILAARSPVFKAMFAHKMSESLENKVMIDELPVAVLRSLLQYVFLCYRCSRVVAQVRVWRVADFPELTEAAVGSASSGTPSTDTKSDGKEAKERKAPPLSETAFASQLLAAADRFQLPDLVELCITHLAGNLDVENFAETLAVAHTSAAAALLPKGMEFIKSKPERVHEVMETEGYKLLDKSQAESLILALAPPNPKKRARPADLAADPSMQQAAAKR